MEKTVRLRYFAACNSEDGFYSFYKTVFHSGLSRRYIIKGGPGTGKSSLMRRVSARAAERGYAVEEILCSSDPESLDGVIVSGADGTFAVLDGTAPHVVEAELPGARDEILYVGDFWNRSLLSAQAEEIARVSAVRAEAYARAYRYLRAAGQCERNMASLLRPLLDREHMRHAAEHLLSRCPRGQNHSERVMLTASIGMSGAVRLPTFEENSDTVFRLVDPNGISHLFLEEVRERARERCQRLWISYDPLIPTQIKGLCLPDCRLSFVPADSVRGGEAAQVHRLTMKKFLSADGCDAVKKHLAEAQKNKEHLMCAALESFRQIRELHFSMESRYVAAMDFDALREHTDRWLENLLP